MTSDKLSFTAEQNIEGLARFFISKRPSIVYGFKMRPLLLAIILKDGLELFITIF